MKDSLLLSIDFRPDKGGIARVAYLMAQSLPFRKIFSLHGKDLSGMEAEYYNKNTFLFSLKTITYIFRNRPSLIVFDHLNIARLLVFIPANWSKKVVIFLHDEEAWREVKGFHKVALQKASHILCNSEFTRRKFLENNKEFTHKTRTCLPGGVPATFEREIQRSSSFYDKWLEDKRPYCLFVSRLWKAHRYKGYWELLEAFLAHYRRSSSAFLRLAIVGNGDDADEVKSFIERQNLSANVSLFTNVKDEDLFHFYKNSNGLFFPSMREGFGMVYLEAMYFGKACIGIKGQPAEEIIVNRKTGKLLPDNRPETLLEVIKEMEAQPDLYKSYGEEGFKRYSSNFTKDHFKQRFLEAIGCQVPEPSDAFGE